MNKLPLGTIIQSNLIGVKLAVVGYQNPNSTPVVYAAVPIPGGEVTVEETGQIIQTIDVSENTIEKVISLGYLDVSLANESDAQSRREPSEQASRASIDPLRSILPVGSIVVLDKSHGGASAIIANHTPFDENSVVTDYLGYRLPYGRTEADNNAVFFNAVDIETIESIGYVDKDTQLYCAALPSMCEVNGIPMPYLQTKKFFGKRLERTDE